MPKGKQLPFKIPVGFLEVRGVQLHDYYICNLRPRVKKPSASTAIAGSLTSSIRYNSLKDGKAIKISIKAGVTVQISSIKVPWLRYLCARGDSVLL